MNARTRAKLNYKPSRAASVPMYLYLPRLLAQELTTSASVDDGMPEMVQMWMLCESSRRGGVYSYVGAHEGSQSAAGYPLRSKRVEPFPNRPLADRKKTVFNETYH